MKAILEKHFFELLGNEELYKRLNQSYDETDALAGIEYYKELDESFGHKYPEERYQDFYQSLISQNKHSDLENLLAEVSERAQLEHQLTVQSDILVKLFPSGSLNAQIRAYREGYLILINECIRELFFDLYGVLMRYRRFQDNILVDEQKETYEREEFLDRWTNILSSYVMEGTYSSNFHDYVIAGNHNSLFQGFVTEIETFVIAHEYAHALLKHVKPDAPQMFSYLSPIGRIEVDQKSWDQEHEADVLGIKILLEQRQTVFNMLSITSAITFFLVDDILTQVNGILSGHNRLYPILTDHPPAKDRMETILTHTKGAKLLEEKYYKIIHTVQAICRDSQEEMVQLTVQKIMAAYQQA